MTSYNNFEVTCSYCGFRVTIEKGTTRPAPHSYQFMLNGQHIVMHTEEISFPCLGARHDALEFSNAGLDAYMAKNQELMGNVTRRLEAGVISQEDAEKFLLTLEEMNTEFRASATKWDLLRKHDARILERLRKDIARRAERVSAKFPIPHTVRHALAIISDLRSREANWKR